MHKLLLVSTLGIALAASASASTFSVSGAGGAIVDATNTPTYPTLLPSPAFSSTVTVVNPVTSITDVTITGLTHTWIGDTHAVLRDPSGVGHNIWVRPGYLNTSTFGNSGDFLGGTYVFVDAGTGGALTLPTSSTTATNPPAGTYQQAFGTGSGAWTSGTNGIDNALLSAVTGPAGTWTLTIYDWAGGDTGSITGWTLNGTDNTGSGPVAFCDPGAGGVLACPCANPASGAGRGCDNSAATGGASIAAAGTASLASDTLVFTSSNQTANGTTIILQGTSSSAGAVFGQGVRCVAGSLKRLYTKSPGGTGGVTAPAGADLSVSAQSSALGDTITAGSHRYYMSYYRDPVVLGGCPGTSTFNGTNALDVTWN